MTDEEILKAVIERAVANGWNLKCEWESYDMGIHTLEQAIQSITDEYFNRELTIPEADYQRGTLSRLYYSIIFSHPFAKAFWPSRTYKERWLCLEYPVCEDGCCHEELEEWQIFLQQMILEEEPLQYLAKFLTKAK